MLQALKKIGFGYLVFGLGFCVGVAFMGVLVGMYGYKLDQKRMDKSIPSVRTMG